MSLLAQGINLNRSTYNQQLIYLRRTRGRIAYLIWKTRAPDKANHSPSEELAPMVTPTTRRNAKRRMTRRNEETKRRQQRGKIVVGKSRVAKSENQRAWQEGGDTRGLLNKKRKAESVAKAMPAPPKVQGKLPSRKQKAQHEQQGMITTYFKT